MNLVERGRLRSALVSSTVADMLPRHVLKRQTEAARQTLAAAGFDAQAEEHYIGSHSPGTSCVISLVYEHGYGGFTALGKRGNPAEQVGRQAAVEAAEFAGSAGTVDSHLADQLLLYMALAEGRSQLRTVQVTEHVRTNAAVACQITGVGVDLDGSGRLTVAGMGLSTSV